MEKFDGEILKDPVQQVEQKEVHNQKEKFLKRLKPHKGHTAYKYHVATGELSKATFVEKDVSFVRAQKGLPLSKNKKIIVEEGYVYLTALNVKNAIKKLAQYYGVEVKLNKK
jgi:hypothetical protein